MAKEKDKKEIIPFCLQAVPISGSTALPVQGWKKHFQIKQEMRQRKAPLPTAFAN